MKILFVLDNLIHESCPSTHHRSYLGFCHILTFECHNTTYFILIRQVSRLSSTCVIRRVGRGDAMGANATLYGPKRSAWKEPKTNEKNAKDESFLLICRRTQLFTV